MLRCSRPRPWMHLRHRDADSNGQLCAWSQSFQNQRFEFVPVPVGLMTLPRDSVQHRRRCRDSRVRADARHRTMVVAGWRALVSDRLSNPHRRPRLQHAAALYSLLSLRLRHSPRSNAATRHFGDNRYQTTGYRSRETIHCSNSLIVRSSERWQSFQVGWAPRFASKVFGQGSDHVAR